MWSAETNLLEVKDLSLAFKEDDHYLEILNQIGFALKPGKTLGLLGESGSGKSLTSIAIMRLLSPKAAYAKESEVLLEGNDLLLLEAFQMRQLRGKKIAMIFQEPMLALNPVRTFYLQIRDVITAHVQFSAAEIHQRILKLMHDVEIESPEKKLHQYPHQWSGGEKQRFLIAMALANHPDVLIADEPTTALDVVVQEQILNLLKKLQSKYGLSILMISHNLEVIEKMADDVMVMYLGEIVETSDASTFWASPLHPYVHQLKQAMPEYAKRGQKLATIAGRMPDFKNLPSGCRFHLRCQYALSICQHSIPNWYQATQSHALRCHLYPRDTPLAPVNYQAESIVNHTASDVKILSVNHLYLQAFKRFSKTKSQYILKGVDFNLYQGETMAIVGQSGCGKSTLAQTIMGLNPHYTGEIKYLGLAVQDFQMIFQDPAGAMNPRWTIHEILAEACPEDLSSCLDMLESVNMPASVLNNYPHELSGGQRQRICIARAILAKPKVLICDEPTSALDISVQAQILNLLKSLQAQFSLTYIFISHDLNVVAYMADKVAMMQDGRFVEQGPIAEIWQHPQHEYTKFMLSLVHKP
ncbi:MAG: ABC transporter ATP-binding protein [Gammaproteobacteria bacterium]|nr:ABC transporter ATP-binding protein [Gammaproteobacteria bacterium]